MAEKKNRAEKWNSFIKKREIICKISILSTRLHCCHCCWYFVSFFFILLYCSNTYGYVKARASKRKYRLRGRKGGYKNDGLSVATNEKGHAEAMVSIDFCIQTQTSQNKRRAVPCSVVALSTAAQKICPWKHVQRHWQSSMLNTAEWGSHKG